MLTALALLSLSPTALADTLPAGQKQVPCELRVEGLDAAPGVSWALYPEGTGFDELTPLEVEDGVLRFTFYRAASPRLWALPADVAHLLDPEVLGGPGEGCDARCVEHGETEELLGCALCSGSEEEYFAALGVLRSAEPLEMCEGVPKEAPIHSITVVHTIEGVEGGLLQMREEVQRLTEAEHAEAQRQLAEDRDAEREALAQVGEAAQDRAIMGQALLLVFMSLALMGAGLMLRRQAKQLGGR